MFTSCANKGFQMQFKNDLCISVQWGTSNYCDRRSFNAEFRSELKQDTVLSGTAEIAIWDTDSKWFDFGNDQVKGYCTTDEVANWINLASKAENLNDLHSMANDFGLLGVFNFE